VQLNDVEVGGATVFPKLNLAARPVKVKPCRLYFDFILGLCKKCIPPEKYTRSVP